MTKILKLLIKLIIALGLIYWLINSGKLDFAILKSSFSTPTRVILAILFMQIDNIIVAYRLRLLLDIKVKNTINFIKLFWANWIGIFFNSVLPGSVTGDIVKIFYIKDLDENLTKKYLLVSVFIDRVLGLLGLISLGGISSIINYSKLNNLGGDVLVLTHINMALFFIVICVLVMIFYFENLPIFLAKSFNQKKYIGKFINKLEELWRNICLFKSIIFKALGVSMIIQGAAILIFWFLTNGYADNTFSLSTAFTVLPIGFIAIAVPIAPAGLGVGHVVFQKLLSFFGIMNGASLFNIYFFVVMFSNLTGVIPYIFHSKTKNLDLEKIEEEL